MTTPFAGLVADVMVRFPKTHSPETTVDDVRQLFEDDHVHLALIIDRGGRLITTIERADVRAATPGSTPAGEVGTLTGRTVRPSDPLGTATEALRRQQRRRFAVVDDSGQLLGLLCLKRSGKGYCSDEGIRERAREAGLG